MSLFIISEWAPLSDGLLWFLWKKFIVTGQFICLASVGVIPEKVSNENVFIFKTWSRDVDMVTYITFTKIRKIQTKKDEIKTNKKIQKSYNSK